MLKLRNHNIILPKYFEVVKKKGNSFVSPALGGVGQGRLNANNNFPPKKIRAKPKQAGKKEGGLGEGIFARLLCPPKAGWGWEAARPCVSKEAKPAKIDSLIVRQLADCARPLKNVSIFAGFAPPSGGEPLGGLARGARQLVQPEKGSRIFKQRAPNWTS